MNRQGSSPWFTALLGVLIALPALGTGFHVPALPLLAGCFGGRCFQASAAAPAGLGAFAAERWLLRGEA